MISEVLKSNSTLAELWMSSEEKTKKGRKKEGILKEKDINR